MASRVVEWVSRHPIMSTVIIGFPVNIVVVNQYLEGYMVAVYSIVIYGIIFFGLINLTYWMKHREDDPEEK